MYSNRGLKLSQVLAVCGISKDQYYYQPKGGKRGRKASTKTVQKQAGEAVEVSNGAVVAFIRSKLSEPFVDYGYRRMSSELQLNGFKIHVGIEH